MLKSNAKPNVVVVGAGIAGASLSAEIAELANVVLLEAEERPGLHATGRSAALFTTGYGPPAVRALSRASEAFLKSPGAFSEVNLLKSRGLLFVGRSDQGTSLATLHRKLAADGVAHIIDEVEVRTHFPLLRAGYADGAIWYPDAWDIDVDALLSGYLRRFKQRGGQLVVGQKMTGLDRTGGKLTVETSDGAFQCDVVVNAAGAWADEVARMCGARLLGITPKKRTAATVKVPDRTDVAEHAMLVDVDEEFYAKPEAGHLLISPADEMPVEAGDAYADELDIAIAADRVQKALDLSIRRIESSWAGLRTFAPDGCPVLGFDKQVDGLFWCAGQGGYGIQTAPAIARLCAHLLVGRPVPEDLTAHGFLPGDVDPRRFGLAA